MHPPCLRTAPHAPTCSLPGPGPLPQLTERRLAALEARSGLGNLASGAINDADFAPPSTARKLGQETGSNTTPQLSFFSAGSDMEADNNFDLALQAR